MKKTTKKLEALVIYAEDINSIKDSLTQIGVTYTIGHELLKSK